MDRRRLKHVLWESGMLAAIAGGLIALGQACSDIKHLQIAEARAQDTFDRHVKDGLLREERVYNTIAEHDRVSTRELRMIRENQLLLCARFKIPCLHPEEE